MMLVCGPAHADEWTAMDTAFQAAFLSVLYVDYRQTMQMQTPEVSWKEYNSFLGDHPTKRDIGQYFAACAVLHTGIALMLPKPYRTVWQVVWFGAEYSMTRTNYRAGLRLEW
jgi:hypothetical protein